MFVDGDCAFSHMCMKEYLAALFLSYLFFVMMWPRGSLDWPVGSYVRLLLGIFRPPILGSVPKSGIDSSLFDL